MEKESSTQALNQTTVAVFGLGFIGRMVFEAIQQQNFFNNRQLKLIGAVDIVRESCEWAKSKGIPAFETWKELVQYQKPDVCIHTTSSSLQGIVPQLKEIIESKVPIVSSCEELFFPWIQNKAIATELNHDAEKHEVSILGTGANPGFIMDVLPSFLTQVCQSIDGLRVERVVNASLRHPPLQRRIGVGLSPEIFAEHVSSGKIQPMGILESLDFLVSYLGLQLSNREHILEPVLAKKMLTLGSLTIKKDHVLGYRQRAIGTLDKKRVIELDLKVFMEAERPGDHIQIFATPPLDVWIEGGVSGDAGAVASLVRGVPLVLHARPGIVRRLERGYFAY